MSQRKNIIVGGLGNPLMTDEGIGLEIIHRLMSRSDLPDFIELMELGSNPMNIVHAIANRQKAILIDCAFMDKPAGTIFRFTPEEVISKKGEAHLSSHQTDLMKALEISKKLGECPEEVVIYGIQPERVTQGDSLSPLLHARLDDYTETISAELLASG